MIAKKDIFWVNQIYKIKKMQKKYLPSLLLFLLGIVITIIGSLFKIMHWPGASIILIVGMLSEAIAIIILIFTLLKKQK